MSSSAALLIASLAAVLGSAAAAAQQEAPVPVAAAVAVPPPYLDVRNRFGFDLGYAPPAALGGFAAGWDPSLFWRALGEFFSLEGVGRTTLGRLMAWKGDIIQPVALFVLGVFVLYTIFRCIHNIYCARTLPAMRAFIQFGNLLSPWSRLKYKVSNIYKYIKSRYI